MKLICVHHLWWHDNKRFIYLLDAKGAQALETTEAKEIKGGKETEAETISAYKALQEHFQIKNTCQIYYPACGDDMKVSEAFPEAEVHYVDTDAGAIKKIDDALSHKYKIHAIAKSATDFQPENDIDLVILNDHGIHGKDPEAHVTEKLKDGGYVLCYNRDHTAAAEHLITMADFELVGYLDHQGEGEKKRYFVNTQVDQIKADLKAKKRDDKGNSPHAGKKFVFQKTPKGKNGAHTETPIKSEVKPHGEPATSGHETNQAKAASAVSKTTDQHATPEVPAAQKSIWDRVRGVLTTLSL